MSKYELSKKRYQSPRWSTELLDCGVPMSLDQYSRCGYNCIYCFSQYQKAISAKETYFSDEIQAIDLRKLKRIFLGEGTGQDAQFTEFTQKRMTLQWGGLADPFCTIEKSLGVGLEVLRFLKEIDYPITFSTKGTWWTKDSRYSELFEGQKNWNVKVSIITLDEEKRAFVEQRCPSSRHRLKAIERVAGWECGGATLRLRPFLIGVTNPTHKKLIQAAADHGATALSTEFFCAEIRSTMLRDRLIALSRMVGFDIMAFYQKYSCGTGYLRLNRNVKRDFVDEMESACREAGMRFFISDAHFKERSDGSCCCGVERKDGWKYSRGTFAEALQIAKRKGTVRWREICRHLQYAKKIPFRLAQGFNTRNSLYRAKFWDFTMYDWVRWTWNHPNMQNSPYHLFEGILVAEGVDEQENVVYKYNKERE